MNNVLEEYAKAVRKSSPRPTEWSDIIGNDRAKEILRESIAAARKDKQPLPHTLLFGPPGVGKTTIAKAVARDMDGGFLETTASTFDGPADVIRYIWQMNAAREQTGNASVLFIDEIHTLGASKTRASVDQESWFTLLEDWQLHHNMIRKTVEDVNGRAYTITDTTTDAWPFTAIGATTEAGALSQPLLRRFLLQIELEPYTEGQIAQILLGAGHRLGYPLTDDAAAILSKYSRRNPGMANSLIAHARARASMQNRTDINAAIATEVVQRLNLYPKGLNETDIRILLALYDRSPKGIGMAECARSVGISLSQFVGLHEPYLRLLSLMETQSRRVIRPEGIRYLADIGKIDVMTPKAIAALAKAA